ALPFVMAGIRLAVGRALIGIITAEMFTAVTGMGALLIRYSSALATDKFFFSVIFFALLGGILSSGVEKLQKRPAPWKEKERALLPLPIFYFTFRVDSEPGDLKSYPPPHCRSRAGIL